MILLKSLLPTNYQLTKKVTGNFVLSENYQLAKKLYIDTGKLDKIHLNWLDRHTDRDYTYKIIASILASDDERASYNDLVKFITQLRNYNKNIFPIKNFSYDDPTSIVTYDVLSVRENIFKDISNWKKIYFRNLKNDIRKERNYTEFQYLLNCLPLINRGLYFLGNKSEKSKIKIENKIFSSKNNTFDKVADYCEDRKNLLSDEDIFKGGKQELYDVLQNPKLYYSNVMSVVYDKKDVMVIDVTDPLGLVFLGKNSLWCFSYDDKNLDRHFDKYSYNGHVYVIIDFSMPQSSSEFMHVVIKPSTLYDDWLYDMLNDPVNEDSYEGGPTQKIINIANGDTSIMNVFTFK